MSGIKRTLEETWYENAGRMELHWMEQEYFNYIACPKNKKNDKLIQEQEEVSYQESERPYIRHAHENDFGTERFTHARRSRFTSENGGDETEEQEIK